MKDKSKMHEPTNMAKPTQYTGFDKVNQDFGQEKAQGVVNAGIGANDVESIVFGSCSAQKEDELLLELERAELEKKSACAEFNVVSDFSLVPENLVFSEFSTYRLFRRSTKRDYFINGKMLEARIGLDNALYQKVKNRTARAFCVGDYIAVFISARLP